MKKFIKSLFSGVIVTSVLLNSINVFASQTQVVKISVGNNIANVNGNDTTLSIAPYIQKSSGAMMIPLRFVSTSLGIDENNIKYNPNTKEISIAYNGKTVKFIVGTNKLIIDGKDFSMLLENKYPVYTEIKNGSTFIPLRSLELAFDNIKIDWENSTKTAILINKLDDIVINVEQHIVDNNNNSLKENNTSVVSENNENTIKTFEDYTDEEVRKMEEEVVRLVNEERVKYGLQPLEISEKLMQTAKIKSKDMSTKNYFAHTDPDSYNIARDLNVGENIASMGMSPKGVVNGWLNSKKGHREQILNPDYKYIGVGVYGSKWTQHFSKDDKWAN